MTEALELCADGISALVERHARLRFPVDDPRWSELVQDIAARQRRRRRKMDRALGLLSRFKRTQRFVRSDYERSWNGLSVVEQLSASGPADACLWREQGYLFEGQGLKLIHNELLASSIELLRPSTVLEVGCGNGFHLFLLALRFPAVAFSGLELTEAGIRASRALQEWPEAPPVLREHAIQPLPDPSAHRRVRFERGTAAEIPLADGSFDLVYTSLALEQMEEIHDRALQEIARVARRHVVMLEPFRDWNDQGIRRDYVESRDIFSGRISELPRYGLKPVLVFDDFPSKVALGVGLIVAEKRSQEAASAR